MAAWARVLIAVCVLICCVRAATAEGAEFGRTGWRGRVNLRPQDRVGFLRFKKVGSTTVSTYLMNRTAVCINSCAAQGSKTKCVQLSCLYTTNCSSCAELRSPAVANRQFCYPCYHLPIRKLSQQFDMHAHEWRTTHSMELADAPHLHLLVVVRDPYERLLSEFFFIRPACNQRKTELVTWLKQYTPQLQTAICNGDFETFATHPDSHATNGQVRQIVDYEFVTDRPLTAAHLELSLRLLAEASLVLVTDRLLPAGLALLDYTFSAETAGMTASMLLNRVPRSGESRQRVTSWIKQDSLRDNLTADTDLRRRVMKANMLDDVFYSEAVRHFEAAYHAMIALTS
eukprot:m.280628 g.280628  ORF g.280628 m.280628 type:complete len:343 (+) comp16170_c0_seq16:44-1072(+)